jgi:uncharacterized membrane protein
LKRRAWLEKESKLWVEQNYITTDQQGLILSQYPESEEGRHGIRWLPILASILIGAGVLSFIASNWQELSETFKLMIIFGSIIGFYFAGEKMYQKGNEMVGLALTMLGILFFGAGIILIGQLYHLVSYNAAAFYVWYIAALLLAYVYRSAILLALAVVIVNIAGYYSLIEFSYFSFTYYALLLGSFPFLISREVKWVKGFMFILLTIYTLIGTAADIGNPLFLLTVGSVLLVAGDFISPLSNARKGFSNTAKVFGYIHGVLFALVIVYELDDSFFFNMDNYEFIYVGTPLLALAFIASVVVRYRQKDWGSLIDWILFIPLFLISPVSDGIHLDWVYILLVFIFSIALFVFGSTREAYRINAGTAFFILATIVAYSNFAWDFLPKSLFFTMGGIILFVVSYILNRKRRQVIRAEGGSIHD